jgi:hypothetical protein
MRIGPLVLTLAAAAALAATGSGAAKTPDPQQPTKLWHRISIDFELVKKFVLPLKLGGSQTEREEARWHLDSTAAVILYLTCARERSPEGEDGRLRTHYAFLDGPCTPKLLADGWHHDVHFSAAFKGSVSKYELHGNAPWIHDFNPIVHEDSLCESRLTKDWTLTESVPLTGQFWTSSLGIQGLEHAVRGAGGGNKSLHEEYSGGTCTSPNRKVVISHDPVTRETGYSPVGLVAATGFHPSALAYWIKRADYGSSFSFSRTLHPDVGPHSEATVHYRVSFVPCPGNGLKVKNC